MNLGLLNQRIEKGTMLPDIGHSNEGAAGNKEPSPPSGIETDYLKTEGFKELLAKDKEPPENMPKKWRSEPDRTHRQTEYPDSKKEIAKNVNNPKEIPLEGRKKETRFPSHEKPSAKKDRTQSGDESQKNLQPISKLRSKAEKELNTVINTNHVNNVSSGSNTNINNTTNNLPDDTSDPLSTGTQTGQERTYFTKNTEVSDNISLPAAVKGKTEKPLQADEVFYKTEKDITNNNIMQTLPNPGFSAEDEILDNNQEIMKDAPILALLTGQLALLNPQFIPKIVTENPFVNEALSQKDIDNFMVTKIPAAALSKMLQIGSDRLPASFQNSNLMISPQEFFKAIGLDPSQIAAELALLKSNLQLEGLSPYIIRSTALRANMIPKNSFSHQTSGNIPPAENTIKEQSVKNIANKNDIQNIDPLPVMGLGASQVLMNPSEKIFEPEFIKPIPAKSAITFIPMKEETLDLPIERSRFYDENEMLSFEPKMIQEDPYKKLGMTMNDIQTVNFETDPELLIAISPLLAGQESPIKEDLTTIDMLRESILRNHGTAFIPADTDLNSKSVSEIKFDPSFMSATNMETVPTKEHLNSRRFFPERTMEDKTSVKSFNADTLPPRDIKPLSDISEAANLSGSRIESSPEKFVFIPLITQRPQENVRDERARIPNKADTAPIVGTVALNDSENDSKRDSDIGNSKNQDFGNQHQANYIKTDTHDLAKTGPAFSIARKPETERIHPHDITERIVKNASMMIKEGGGSIKIDLGSKELGDINLAIQVKDNNLDLRIVADSDKVREIIAGDLPRLRESLSEQKLNLNQVEIGLGGGRQWSASLTDNSFGQGQFREEYREDLAGNRSYSYSNSYQKTTDPVSQRGTRFHNGKIQVLA
ncbi:MAG: flagellar hook-length control protein FliK [Oligoflexales bacterium]|nr:flagellar hook-length control protein FliK [Oligoflexales bacterium]